jgi:branched-chain amino acid transport system substrate-binding protein
LLLQKAILNADSVDTQAVKAALDAMNIFTFYGGIKFDTSAEAHGLQTGHSMVVIQWQKNEAGDLVREVVWPADVATKKALFPITTP